MKVTLRLRLHTDPATQAVLRETLEQSTDGFNAVCRHGWQNRERNGTRLHQATYKPLREAHPDLPSQRVVSARKKATEALKSVNERRQRQAHNREAGWYLVFRFVADTQTEEQTQAIPFQIVEILAAELTLQDWSVSRGAEGDDMPETGDAIANRRTRTTSTNASGTRKLRSNPVYADPAYAVKHKDNLLWVRRGV